MCEAVCVPLRIEPPLYRRRVDFYTKSRAFDTTRARAELGYAPRVPLDEGLRLTAAWYRERGLL
jgi:nucleoside-diphosphate-sugar epimerase